MKIAYLVSQYPATSHTFIRREIAELRRRGLDLDVFSVRRADPSHIRTEADRAALEETFAILPVGPLALVRSHLAALVTRPLSYLRTLRLALSHRVGGARAALWSLFHFAEAIHLARALEAAGVEHLHNHFANASANVGLLATRFLGIDFSLTLHGTADFDYPAGPLLPSKIRAARFVACVSHFGRAQALRVIDPADWEKLFVSRCGVELVPPPERHEPNPRFRFVCVGRLSVEKGHTGLLEAFASLIEEGVDAELLLIGDGPSRSLIEAAVVERGLESRVTLPGAKSETEVLEAVARADAFVLPSLMEGLPVVLMEAMMLRCPVVAPRLSGIPELVIEEKTGLLFTPADWSELCTEMRRLASDADLRERLCRDAEAKVREEFAIAPAVEALYERLSDRALGEVDIRCT